MKFILIVALLCVAGDSVWARKKAKKFKEYHLIEPTDDPDNDHKSFLKKVYPNYVPDQHHHIRKKKFHACRDALLNWDPNAAGYAIGINQFCHWTDDEFKKSLNPKLNPDVTDTSGLDARFAIEDPDTFNRVRQTSANFSWIDQGAVSTVKDQGSCGCCYTFAAAAALEGAYKIKYGVLVNVSTQQYVDCTVNYTVSSNTRTSTSCRNGVCTTTIKYYDNWFQSPSGNEGCGGGTARACWSYNNITGTTQDSWECYGFYSGDTAQGGPCQNPACNVQIGVAGYVNVPANNETALLNAVAVSPVACAIDASTIQSYAGGIFTGGGCSTTNLNHAITVVGYGSAGGVNYWLIKNSWDVTWGENGYMRLLRGSNTCGISSSCAYPVVI